MLCIVQCLMKMCRLKNIYTYIYIIETIIRGRRLEMGGVLTRSAMKILVIYTKHPSAYSMTLVLEGL